MKRAFAIIASSTRRLRRAHGGLGTVGVQQQLRIIVPYPPGGTTDMIARLTGQKLGELTGQQSIVENRPGAGGNIGTQAVARAARDGLTIGISAVNTFSINPHLVKDLPYDPVKDLEPICLIGFMPNIIVVNPSVPARSLVELIALAKKQPLSFSSPGSGTSVHLAGELLNEGAGISLQHVPYKGDAPALQDVLGGRIEVMVANLPGAIEHVRAGKLRPIAVTAAQPLAPPSGRPHGAGAGRHPVRRERVVPVLRAGRHPGRPDGRAGPARSARPCSSRTCARSSRGRASTSSRCRRRR